MATGCRAREITGLEWNRVDLDWHTAWLNQTKNGTPRRVPLNHDALQVLKELGGWKSRGMVDRYAKFGNIWQQRQAALSLIVEITWSRWKQRGLKRLALGLCL